MDRNRIIKILRPNGLLSLSARRAWIEITRLGGLIFTLLVALRKESVDRNYGDNLTFADGAGRSPQGERG